MSLIFCFNLFHVVTRYQTEYTPYSLLHHFLPALLRLINRIGYETLATPRSIQLRLMMACPQCTGLYNQYVAFIKQNYTILFNRIEMKLVFQIYKSYLNF